MAFDINAIIEQVINQQVGEALAADAELDRAEIARLEEEVEVRIAAALAADAQLDEVEIAMVKAEAKIQLDQALADDAAKDQAEINALKARIAALEKQIEDGDIKPPPPPPPPPPDPEPEEPPVEPPPPPPPGSIPFPPAPEGTGPRCRLHVSDENIKEGETTFVDFSVADILPGQKLGLKISGTGINNADFEIDANNMLIRQTPDSHGAFLGGGAVTFPEGGTYVARFAVTPKLDKLVETTDKASWISGRQEQMDVFITTITGQIVALNSSKPIWITDMDILLPPPPPGTHPDAPLPAKIPLPNTYLPGVNLAVGEFGSGLSYDKDYTYPKPTTFGYYAGKGMKILRFPVREYRLIDTYYRLRPDDIRRLKERATACKNLGLWFLLDMHTYGRTQVGIIGETPLAAESFAWNWGIIAKEFVGFDNVIFGLSNEPHDQSVDGWVKGANMAIKAIRNVGCGNPIFVCGAYWSGMHSWKKNNNQFAMLNIQDPLDNVVYEGHQYFNHDSSGSPPKVDPITGERSNPAIPGSEQRAMPMIEWAREHNKRIFCGEWGFSPDPDYMEVGDKFAAILRENAVDKGGPVLGYAYWAGGPWWSSKYTFDIEPPTFSVVPPEDRPQMAVLTAHL